MTLRKATDVMRSATKKAFDQATQVLGKPVDPELIIYQKLNADAFVELMKRYGETDVLDYIRTMEARRMKNG